MNGVYVNAAGREKHGVVRDDARRSLLEEIRDKLLEVRDVDGTPAIVKAVLVEDVYPSADPGVAPDLLVGYNDGYRSSWETVLGGIPQELITDNLDRWSGEHLISDDLVPGVLLANRPLSVANPAITDIAPTILAAYGIAPHPQMIGRDLFVPASRIA
jgi:predicted AlkP superfamily phosphohydrolase/phosphomutase